MLKGFPTQTTQKSKMSQEGEEEEVGKKVHLDLLAGGKNILDKSFVSLMSFTR